MEIIGKKLNSKNTFIFVGFTSGVFDNYVTNFVRLKK